MKNNPSAKRLFTCAWVAGALLLAAAGCSHHEGNGPSSPLAPSTPAPQAVSQAPKTITIYRLAQNEDQAKEAPNHVGLVPVSIPAPDGQSPEQAALSRLADQPDSPLPKGTKVLAVTVDNGLATADFSSEFKKNFTGGDTEEAQVIDSVLQTLGQYPNISNVQFLVDGQKIDSLGGTQDLGEPLPVIRPDQAQAAGEKQNIAMNDGSAQ